MKKIFLLTALIVCIATLIGCSDTKDCSCTVEIAKKSALQKSTTQQTVSDWDTDCDKITADDVPGWTGDPCTEI